MTVSSAAVVRLASAFSLLALLSAPASAEQTKPAAPPPSQRTESVNYDHWVVTCQEVSGAAKKVCVGSLRVIGSDGKQPVANWQIGFNKENRLVSVFQVPPSLTAKTKDDKVSTGVSTKSGAEIKLGNASPRRMTYEGCTPQVCEAVLPVDDGFIKEAGAAASTSVTVTTLDGATVPMTFDSKGLDKTIAAVSAKKVQ